MLKYRHPTEDRDRAVLDAWVASDPDHCNTTTGSYFLVDPVKDAGQVAIAVEDDEGTVFYLKFTNAVFVDAQFPPDLSEAQRARARSALNEAFVFFSQSLKKQGIHAMLFDSVSRPLIRFFEKKGFKRLKDFFKVGL